MESFKLREHFCSHGLATIERCKSLMEPDDLREACRLRDLDSVMKQVLDQREGEPASLSVPYEVSRIKLTLGHINHFTDFFDSNFGLDLNSSFLWGCIGTLLRIISTSENEEALSSIPSMLKKIGYQIEAFNSYYNAWDNIGDPMREVCFDIQMLLIEFIVHAIRCTRGECENELHDKKNRFNDPWQLLDYTYAISEKELRDMLTRVERMSKINSSGKAWDEQSLTSYGAYQPARCWMLSPTKISGFFDRVDVFSKIDQVLEPKASNASFRSVALFGLQGIGKSAIAARYSEARAEERVYDSVFWVSGERTTSLQQGFTDVALRLKLRGAKKHNHDENLILVQDWFQSTDCRWLVVYDNVESANVLMPFWPGASHGRAIITTRNHSLALQPAASGLEIFSWDAKDGSDFLLFLLKQNIGEDIQSETNSAYELSKRLSGHALGISHMAGLIHERSWSISEFMKAYLKNPRRAHETELQVVWNLSFQHLETRSLTFLGILSFLMPDVIQQSLFDFDIPDDDMAEELAFCYDDFEFSDATKPLLALSLVKRNMDTRIFSTHRLVQTHFKLYLSPAQRQIFFDIAVALVYRVFPKQNRRGAAQLYEHWEECSRYLQHVLALKDCFKEEMKCSKNFKATWKFGELLNDCQRYLYETNSIQDLEELSEVGIIAVKTLDDQERIDDLTASFLSQQANMSESLGMAERAIEFNKKAYEIRLHEKTLKQARLAGFENNLGYNYNTANDHKTALEWLERSRSRWLLWGKTLDKPDWPAFMKRNMARCLVYLNDFDGAGKMIEITIAELKSAKPFSWAMLSSTVHIRATLERRKGHSELAEASFIEAQNIWLKGDQARLHPFNASCIYKIGATCLDQGKVEAAVKHLRDALEITQVRKHIMPIEHARALFKISEALLQETYDGSEEEAMRLRDEAERYLKQRDPDATEFGTEDAYDRFVPIFWR